MLQGGYANQCLPLCNATLCKIVQVKKKQRRGRAMHDPPLVHEHNCHPPPEWPSFICCIWFLIAVTITKLGNIIIVKLHPMVSG